MKIEQDPTTGVIRLSTDKGTMVMETVVPPDDAEPEERAVQGTLNAALADLLANRRMVGL